MSDTPRTSAVPKAPQSQCPDLIEKEEVTIVNLLVPISPKKVTLALILASVVLTLVSFAGHLLRSILGEFVRLINVGSELSVPTWYSATLLLLCSVLFATITLAKKQHGDRRALLRWGFLSLIFLYLSLDDMLTLHERISSTLLQPGLHALGYEPGGFLSYPWVILYAPLVLLFVLVYLRFWLNLPARVRFLFLVAGVLFVGGGFLTEMFNAWYASVYGRGTVFTAAMTHLEELLEMLGPSILVYALLSYLGMDAGEVRLRIREAASGQSPEKPADPPEKQLEQS